MKKLRNVILGILATVLLIPTVSTPTIIQAEESNQSSTIRVATHNIAAPNEAKAKTISKLYNTHNIDIVGVQEADMFNGRNDYDTIKTLENDVLKYSRFAKGRDYNDGDFGIGFISKYSILEHSSEPVEHPSGSAATKVIERAVIEVGTEKVALYNVHFSWEDLGLRQRQMKELKDRLNQDPIKNVILMGDFNVDQHLMEYSIFRDQFDMANGGSFGFFDTYLEDDDPNMKHNKIDNILVSKNMTIENVVLVGERSLSDHALFYADIKIDGGSIPVKSDNIMPGKYLSYSHAPQNVLETYDVYAITDGGAAGFSGVSTNEEQTINIDLHQAYKLEAFSLSWNSAPTEYKILAGLNENDLEEIYSGDASLADVDIIVDDNVKVMKIVIKGAFNLKQIFATGEEVYDIIGDNEILNGDLSILVPEPQTQPPGFEAAHWDTDMWVNKEKPEHWIYQKYKVTEQTSDYVANVLPSDRDGSTNNMVEITKNNSASGFFKQMKTPMLGNTKYMIGFWYKNQNVSKDLKLSISEYNGANKGTQNFVLNDLAEKSNNEWVYYEHTWTTNASTEKFDIVFRVDGVSGTYNLEDISLVQKMSYPQEFKIARHTIDTHELETGESTQVLTNYFPLTPEEAGISVAWVSEDESVAVVSPTGVITGVGQGETYISMRNNVSDRFYSDIKVRVTGDDVVIEPTNLIVNGDFEQSEEIPTNPQHYSDDTFHDAGLWRDTQVKPSSWMFQKWKPAANTDDFKAYYLEEDGNSYVKVDVSTKANDTMNFFKNIEIPVEKGKRYIVSADIQQLISEGDLLIRIERNNNARINRTFNGVDEEVKDYYYVFNSDGSDNLNLIIGYEQNARGSYTIDNVKLVEYDGKAREIEMDQEDIIMHKDGTASVNAVVLPEQADDRTIKYMSSDETIATVDSKGVVKAISAGSATITATANNNSEVSVSKQVKVVDGDIDIDNIKINNLENTLKNGEMRFLHVDTEPGYATEGLSVVWSSSNEDVASFEGNKLVTHKAGTTTITATHKSITDSKTLTVQTKEIDDYRIMRDRWRNNLIGNETTMDLSDADIKRFVDQLDSKSTALFDSMHKEDERVSMSSPELWDVVDTTAAAHMTTQFRNLYTLAQAFMIEGTTLYQNEKVFNEVLAGFDFMMTVKKYTGNGYTGNWWDWQIGSAQPFAHTLLILDDYLTLDQKVKYVAPIKGYTQSVSLQIPSVTSSGANRTDIAISVLATAIILEDKDRMDQIPKYIPSVMFNENSGGDGYYIDGSFVQHGDKAYSGSYGVETIRGLSTIISIIDGTKWGFSESTENYTNLYSIIPDTYFPIVHKGMNMAMNQGRSISRAPGTNKFAPAFSGGAELSANLLTLADYMPEELETSIKEHVKLWYQDSKEYYDYMEHTRDLEMLLNLKALMADETIEPKVSEGLKVMTAMARVINIREKYSAGVSMTSYKISNYESGNTENPYGFHTGDGMLYLYNDDLTMYGDSYWPTVDWYRLPGITVDTRTLKKDALSNKTSSDMRWVGGVSNGLNGSSGMTLDKSKQNKGGTTFDLKAKKSYFFIDDKIVAVGSDISGNTNATIETVVENRLLNKEGSNTVVFNGDVVEYPQTKQVSKNDWVHLEGITDNASIGYYFLEDAANVELNEVKRSGTYNDINNYFGTDTVYEEDYFLLSVHHGKTVSDDKYAYVILPGLTADQTETAVQEESVKIVENSKDIHAVIDEKAQVFAANVFTKGETTFDLSGYDFPVDSITVNNAPSIIVEVNQLGELTVEVSSPRREGDESNIELTLSNGKVITKGNKIKEVVETDDKLSFTFISNGLAGRSDGVTVTYKVDEDVSNLIDELKALYDVAVSKEEMKHTVTSWNKLTAPRDAAKELLERLDVLILISKEDLQTAITNLQAALDQLELAGDLEKAQELIDSIDLSKYTEFTQSELRSLIESLESLIDGRETQIKLDDVIKELNKALEDGDKVIDLDKYKNALEIYETINEEVYTEASVKVFKDAYKVLSELVDAYDETQALTVTKADLDKALDALVKAFSDLKENEIVEPVDPKLEKLREDAKKLLEEVSKRESMSDELRKEAAKLTLMLADDTITYDELLEQYERVLKLHKKTEVIIDEDKDKEKEKDEKDVPTGIINLTPLWISLFAIGILYVIFDRKRKSQRL